MTRDNPFDPRRAHHYRYRLFFPFNISINDDQRINNTSNRAGTTAHTANGDAFTDNRPRHDPERDGCRT